jgi:hypothetical protein
VTETPTDETEAAPPGVPVPPARLEEHLADRPAATTAATVATFTLPPDVLAQVSQARANAAALAAEWTGYANGLVRGYLTAQKITPREDVGTIASSGQFTVEVPESPDGGRRPL